jgi:hypothetical protein
MIETKIGNVKKLLPIIFPDQLVHAEMYNLVRRNLIREHGMRETEIAVHSAGQIEMFDISCHGESETLGIKSNTNDSKTIENYSVLHGIA